MTTDSALPAASIRPGSRYTVASWVALLGGLLLTFGVYQWAVIHRQPGEWLPGIGEAIIGIAITALASFGCGLTALLRRERRRGLALLPFLSGLGTILYFAWNLITRH